METSEVAANELLKRKYDLHNAPEVGAAAKRHTGRTGERVPQDQPLDRIQNYLNRFHEITGREDPKARQHGIDASKRLLHRKYVILPENIPQSYWNLQGEIAIGEGRKQDLISAGVFIKENTVQNPDGTSDIKRSFAFPDEVKEQAVRTVIANQEQSLDRWVDYLTSDDALYPMWAKYWAFRSVVKMGKLEKTEDGRARFATREKNTVASFPVLNQRALANTISAMSAQLETKAKPKGEQAIENLSTTLTDEAYQKLLATEDFSKLYAQFLSEIPEYSAQGLEETRGKWVKYDQGTDPTPLVTSLEGHPLEWCTADIDTARTHLEAGDFYVYYSLDGEGNPKIPRVAIRMEGSRIAEPPRGIAPNQNLDPFISEVLEKKLEDFGSEGQAFKKRATDMKRLTHIEQKTLKKQNLDADDLRFLYELDSSIEGFGYEKDPRIEELRSQRNPEEDMPIVFGCEPSQIAHSPSEISPDTKAYVGPLFPGIFDRLQEHNIEHVYMAFPEGKIRRQQVEIGGKTKEQLRQELEQAGVTVTALAEDMMRNPDFATLQTAQMHDIVRLKVDDIVLSSDYPTTDQLYKRAQELGLELCPPELGPQLRLQHKDQPTGDHYWIGMKQITGSRGFSGIFALEHYGDGVWLRSDWVFPESEWNLENEFVFSLRSPAGEAGKRA